MPTPSAASAHPAGWTRHRVATRSHMRTSLRSLAALAATLGALTAMSTGACSSKPKRTVKEVQVVPPRDVPDFLRGTVGAETTLRGSDPILVSGIGLVVGLNGTGGGELPPAIAATMVREMSLNGVGQRALVEGSSLEGVSPEELLSSKDIAVVIVEAQIAPGSPERSRFDVFVRALPGSGVTSLEGGKLWTTDLRIGPAAVFGARKTRKLAEASGPLFISPFSDTLGGAGQSELDESKVTISRTVGRVLDGGVVSDPLRLEVVLDNPSHSRARSMVNAINQRFPKPPSAPDPTARGRAGDSVTLEIPREYAERPDEFIQLIRHLRIDSSYADAAAIAYVRALKEQPGYSDQLRWCLAALGEPAKRALVTMYDYPELAPRMAALEAGALLGDPRTTAPLIDIMKNAPDTNMRLAAMDLLGRMGGNPNANFALRELLDAPALELRVSAYEALSELSDPSIQRTPIFGADPSRPLFIVEEVPSNEPLIYVTQQGEPRIAIFGGRRLANHGALTGQPLQVETSLLTSMWNDRLLMNAESSQDLRIRFKDERRNKIIEASAPREIAGLIAFLAHRSSPEDPRPGLSLNYSEVVGVLAEMAKQKAIPAAFATEEDRLKAEVFQAAQATLVSDRPEDSERTEDIAVQVWRPLPVQTSSADKTEAQQDPAAPGSRRSKIVPLAKPAPKN